MNNLLANIFLAMGVAFTPVADKPNFQVLGVTPAFTIEVDLNSVETAPKIGGWEVRTVLRRTLTKHVEVEGKTQKGTHYIDHVLVRCAQDTFTVESTRLLAADGTVLASLDMPFEVENQHIEGNFISDFIELNCNNNTKAKPKLVV